MKFYKLASATIALVLTSNAQASPISITSGETANSSYLSENQTNTPLFAIGIYEPNNEHGWQYIDGEWIYFQERGTATVFIDEQYDANLTLALGSYEPTDWMLEGPGVSNVSNIILHGYHDHTVNGFEFGSVIQEFTYEGTGSYFGFTFYWPQADDVCLEPFSVPPQQYSANSEICRAYETIENIESLAGTAVTAFVGAYSATEFYISQPTLAAVPIPATMWLFASGFIGMFGFARSQYSKA